MRMAKRILEENKEVTVPEPLSKIAKYSSGLGIYCGGGFEKLVTESSIFVDKSLFIKEIINNKDEVTLITMPRRWGKSSNLDMLKKFLEIQIDENGKVIEDKKETLNYKLFAGGEIQIKQCFIDQTITIKTSKLIQEIPQALDYQGQHPVIFIDFKDCKSRNVQEVEKKLRDKIIKTIKQFGYLSKDTKPYENCTVSESYTALLNAVSNDDFSTGIKELTGLLHTHHGKKVWILIDEYDAAANQAYREFSSESAKEVAELFRGIFEASFKFSESASFSGKYLMSFK